MSCTRCNRRRSLGACRRQLKHNWKPPVRCRAFFLRLTLSSHSTTTNLALLLIILIINLLLLSSVTSLDFPPHQNIVSNQLQPKNSGHFQVSQLCLSNSQFPITKRIEGAVLSSQADADINCTITFRTKTSQQHFVIRFEELKLGCDDHLKMFDADMDYGQSSIKDFSCRDNLASVPFIRTTGSFLTMRYSTDSKASPTDGFRLVVTAVFDQSTWECPVEYALCASKLCISRSLFCDDVNHCLDNSDESSCSSRLTNSPNSQPGLSILTGDLSLTNALGLLVVLVLVIFTCVIVFISAIYCRRENHYAQYQHHLQRAPFGLPLQTSSSLMFAHPSQAQYHYFQPAQLSPYVTPQHQPAHLAMTTHHQTLPRGYSTLPLNLARQHQHQQPVVKAAANNLQQQPTEYLMMASLAGPPTPQMQAAPRLQTSLYLPTSQSIIATPLIRTPVQQQQQQPQPQVSPSSHQQPQQQLNNQQQ